MRETTGTRSGRTTGEILVWSQATSTAMVPPVGITIYGIRPLALNKKQAGLALGSVKSLQRMLWCARHQPGDPWLKIVREGGPGIECLIDTASLEAAYARIYRGETPPLMPSEKRAHELGRN
jgi:hypothetical protein